MAKDYYQILGIPRNATKDEIKKAYRKLAHQFHPDKGGDEARFKEVNEAYQILSNDEKRSQYDQFGRVFEGGQGFGQSGFGFEWPGGFRFDGENAGNVEFDFSDIFEDFLGGFGGGAGRARTRDRKGRDIKIELEIPFEESIFGGKNEVELSKLSRCARCEGTGGEPGSKLEACKTCDGKGNVQKTQKTFLGSFTQVSTCSECQGSGKRPDKKCHECHGKGVLNAVEKIEVFIPKGIKAGETLKITGRGEASATGGIPGDLYIRVRVRAHAHFRRQEDDIVMELPIRLSQAVLGDSVDVDTLEGAIKLKIPEGTQAGDVLKVRGKGAPSTSGYGRGDLLVQIKVDIPRRISKKTKELVQELKKEGL